MNEGLIIDKDFSFDKKDIEAQITISSNLRRIRLNNGLSEMMDIDVHSKVYFYEFAGKMYILKGDKESHFQLSPDGRKNGRKSFVVNSTKLVAYLIKAMKYDKLKGTNIRLKVSETKNELKGCKMYLIDF